MPVRTPWKDKEWGPCAPVTEALSVAVHQSEGRHGLP